MSVSADFAADLAAAEQRLRGRGLTGAAAFEAVRDTLLHRAGKAATPHPALSALRLPEAELDLLGLAYERFFPDVFKGRLGQFFTPRPVVELLLSRLPIGPGVEVVDPTAGSGGMLVQAARRGAVVRGVDVDPRMVDLARLNLVLAGFSAQVVQDNFFTRTPEPADVLIANPPFSVEIRERAILDRFELGRNRPRAVSDVLFLEAIKAWVRPGGWAGLVLPWTFIANGAAAPVRNMLDAHWCRRGVCALPEGVFRPFGGAGGRAALVWLQRRPCVDGRTSWGDLQDPGYDVRSTRLVPTDSAEVDALVRGENWRPIVGWLPAVRHPGTPLSDWVTCSTRTVKGGVEQLTVDLADTDRRTGEVHPRMAANRGRRAALEAGMVVVSRMRPELGNVAIIPQGLSIAGSPEWIRLVCDHPHVLLHALRTPTWRAQLPPTTGQTRPRTDVKTVLATTVRCPTPPVRDRLEALSASMLAERSRLMDQLAMLQEAMDLYADGGPEEDLVDVVSGLEEERCSGSS